MGKDAFAEDSSLDKINLPKIRINPYRISIIEIASGCMKMFILPNGTGKGRLRSYRIGEILRQIRSDIADGAQRNMAFIYGQRLLW